MFPSKGRWEGGEVAGEGVGEGGVAALYQNIKRAIDIYMAHLKSMGLVLVLSNGYYWVDEPAKMRV